MTSPSTNSPDFDAASVADHVEAFIGLHDRGEAPSVGKFCLSLDATLRDRVRQECHEYLAAVTGLLEGGARPSAWGPRRLGDYRVVDDLGAGGMAQVYLGVGPRGEKRAIKVLSAAYARSPISRQRFRREAELGQTLDHPQIVPVLEVGREEGFDYLVMPLADGGTLADLLRSTRDLGQRISATRVVDILIELMEALVYAHERGVWHRDLKPQNVVFLDGRACLIDFGLADQVSEESLTRQGEIIGTLQYMSPEQALASRVVIDQRTDVYSMGALLYEMLTLQLLFSATDAKALIHDIAFADPKSPRRIDSAIHPDLETICLKALEKAPRHRYQRAEDMLEDLYRFRRHRSIRSRPLVWGTRQLRRLGRNRPALAGIAGALLVVVLMTTWWLTRDARPELSFEGLAPGQRVWITERGGREPSQARFLGQTPLDSLHLDAGYYRITVSDSAGRFAELGRWIESDHSLEAPAAMRPSGAFEAEMIVFRDRDEFIAGRKRSEHPIYRERRYAALPPFAIDRREVNFGEYRRFLRESGRSAPARWVGDEAEAWAEIPDDRPVTGIRFSDAEAYAEWVGKRLPTRLEWERAARGRKGATSLVEGSAHLHDVAVFRVRELVAVPQKDQSFRDFRRHVVSAASRNDDVSLDGVLHLMGNLSEFVDDYYVTPDERIVRDRCLTKGGSFATNVSAADFATYAVHEACQYPSRLDVGFRCAKSLNLPPRK